jgi:nicotinamidase-related amidase
MTQLTFRSVVVLLDCMEGVAAGNLPDANDRAAFVTATTALLEHASATNTPVVRVDVSFRDGHPEVAASNAYFSVVKANGRLVEGSDPTRPMAELSDLLTEAPRVVKRRIGGFAGSDLEMVLRGLGRTHLVLAGLITRGAILSTACLAADLDYEVTVARDACADPDTEAHRVLMDSVLTLRGTVADVDAITGKEVAA